MHTIHLPYNTDSEQLFSHFVHLPYAIWLDSGRPRTDSGRYDIISAAPDTLLLSTDKGTTIVTNKNSTHTADDIFAVTQHQLSQLATPKGNDSELPFTIGAIGYCAYDLAWQLECLPTIAKRDIALPNAVIGIYHWSIVIDHETQTTILSSDTLATQTKILRQLNQASVTKDAFELTEAFTTNLPFAMYQQRFQQLQQHISAGDCYEANLCQRFAARFNGSPWHAYRLLRQHNAAPFAAYMGLTNAALLSCSPERFLQVESKRVTTKPIKGTAPRFADTHTDQHSAYQLQKSEKDKAENLMIVDLMRNDLSKCCIPGSVEVPKLFALESFTNVHHLVSTVTGTLRDELSALDLWRACFPGGSITGAPKIRAMEIIETLEPHHRSAYCGSIGYVDINGNMDSNITIRTIICDDDRIYCYGGGAITSDSVAEAEYNESIIKVQKLMRSLSANTNSPPLTEALV